MKSLFYTLLLATLAPALSAAQPGQAMPKLAPLLPGAKLPNTAGKVVLVDF